MNRWKPYRTAFRVHAVRETRYRGAVLGGIVTQSFFGLVLVALYSALIDPADQTLLRETATYVWLQQIFFRALFHRDSELSEQVLSGNVCYQLLRPVDPHTWWLFRAMAEKTVGVLMRLLPMLALQFLLPEQYRMLPPDGPMALLQFALSIGVGFLVIAQINLICQAITMVTLDNRGVTAMINLIMMLLAGNIIPLTLVPERLRQVIRYQPFAQALDAPIRMYLHTMSAGEWLLNLGVQLLWLAALWALSRLLWRRNLDRIVIQGG